MSLFTRKTKRPRLPVLPLRDLVFFPWMVAPIFVGRERSVHALDAAMNGEKQLLLVPQRDAQRSDPAPEDLYDTGTVATVVHMLRLPDQTIKVLLEGVERARVVVWHWDTLQAEVERIDEGPVPDGAEKQVEALKSVFAEYVRKDAMIPPELLAAVVALRSERLCSTIASYVLLPVPDKFAVLAEVDPVRRVQLLTEAIRAVLPTVRPRNEMPKTLGEQQAAVRLASAVAAAISGNNPAHDDPVLHELLELVVVWKKKPEPATLRLRLLELVKRLGEGL